MLKNWRTPILELRLKLLLYFLFDPKANLYTKNRLVTSELLELHLSLRQTAYQQLTEKLSHSFATPGADQDFALRYFTLLEGDTRVFHKEGELMLVQLTVIKNGLTWG